MEPGEGTRFRVDYIDWNLTCQWRSVSICIFESCELRDKLTNLRCNDWTVEEFVPPAAIADAFDPRAIETAGEIIKTGGLVAFPTETVYGLGADAENPQAVARIFEAKARPRIDPIIVHVSNPASAGRYGIFPHSAQRLIKHFWPGPLTLVVAKTEAVPEIVTAGLDTVAIRIPSHPAALALLRASGCAIAAPSANAFGYASSTTAQHVAEHLGEKIEMILDGGPCAIGVESTILSLTGPVPTILRAGGVPVEDLAAMLGDIEVALGKAERPAAPGQMKRHYSTRTLLEICERASEISRSDERIGLLTLNPPDNPAQYAAVEVLSPSGNLREAAANFFGALRRLDALSLDRIIARPIPEVGLGFALMDRLRRAAARE
jgi:L-threonylcarbamoyladenylate synthase